MIQYNKNLKQKARELRNNSTLGEIILWKKVLQGKKYGYTFNRQFAMGNFIVDFICRKLKLIIEVDGYSHNFKVPEDIKRDNELTSEGYKVLRFTEQEIRKDLYNVIRAIEYWVGELKNNNAPEKSP